MNAHTFMSELGIFYAVGGSEQDKITRFDKYATLIAEQVAKLRGQYNYERLLKYIEINFEKFPSVKAILDCLPVGIEIETCLSGREGETIKRTLNGVEYEFTIVPNSWDGIKTISELDRDIVRRSRGEEYNETKESA